MGLLAFQIFVYPLIGVVDELHPFHLDDLSSILANPLWEVIFVGLWILYPVVVLVSLWALPPKKNPLIDLTICGAIKMLGFLKLFQLRGLLKNFILIVFHLMCVFLHEKIREMVEKLNGKNVFRSAH